jgi:large subunit ribosomal protein L28e
VVKDFVMFFLAKRIKPFFLLLVVGTVITHYPLSPQTSLFYHPPSPLPLNFYSMNQSPELVWALLKKQNRFVIKRNGVTFSTEPGNVRNLNKFKYSGLAPKKIVSVEPGPRSHIILSYKRKGRGHKPATQFIRIVLKKDPRRVNHAVRHYVRRYRPDLLRDILARVTRIRAVQKARLSRGETKTKAAATTTATTTTTTTTTTTPQAKK